MPRFRHLLPAMLLVATGAVGCQSTSEPTMEDAAPVVDLPDDPEATAAELVVAFDETLRGLDGRYAFDLVVDDGTGLRIEGVHLGDRSTTTRLRDETRIETIVIDGSAVARYDGGEWVPVELPTDHDPLAPLFAITEVAVTGWDVEASYPADLLGLDGDWVGVLIETDETGRLTLNADVDGVSSELAFRPVSDGLTIDPP